MCLEDLQLLKVGEVRQGYSVVKDKGELILVA